MSRALLVMLQAWLEALAPSVGDEHEKMLMNQSAWFWDSLSRDNLQHKNYVIAENIVILRFVLE